MANVAYRLMSKEDWKIMWSLNDSSILNLDCKMENRYGSYAINGECLAFAMNLSWNEKKNVDIATESQHNGKFIKTLSKYVQIKFAMCFCV